MDFISQLSVEVVGGVLLAILGIGVTRRVIIHRGTSEVSKGGKKMIILAYILGFSGLFIGADADWDMNTVQAGFGLPLVLISALLYGVGKVVAWYQG